MKLLKWIFVIVNVILDLSIGIWIVQLAINKNLNKYMKDINDLVNRFV